MPMLVISGVNRRDSLGQGLGLLHELPDQAAMVRSALPDLSDHRAAECSSPCWTRPLRALTTGRPGPVHIEVPTDVMPLPCPPLPAPPPRPASPPCPTPEPDRRGRDALTAARRPRDPCGWRRAPRGAPPCGRWPNGWMRR